MQDLGLRGFIANVRERMLAKARTQHFATSHLSLLEAAIEEARPSTTAAPEGDPLAAFYWICRANGWSPDREGIILGGVIGFYLLAADLADDVQDRDLAGKSHEAAGEALAVNDAFTFLFLGLDCLREAMELEPDPGRRMAYLAAFNRVSLSAVRGQHLDLCGGMAARSPAEVLAIHRDKTSSLALVTEVAALHAGCSPSRVAAYREIGEGLAVLVQLLDDVRDVFGRDLSSDLANGTLSYPIAVFRSTAPPEMRARLAELVARLSVSQEPIRALLDEAGAFQATAEAVEGIRRDLHAAIAGLAAPNAAHRMLLLTADGLAGLLYDPPELEVSRPLFEPQGAWHRRVRELADDFRARMAPLEPPPSPRLVAWSQPQWRYDPEQQRLYYPDLEELEEEILPQYARTLGIEDLYLARRLATSLAPLIVAHELFHRWRNHLGLLTADSWFEELAANSLAVAYGWRHHPELLVQGLAVARSALARVGPRLSGQARAILRRLEQPGAGPQREAPAEAISAEERAVIDLELIARLSAERPRLEQTVATFLRTQRKVMRAPAGNLAEVPAVLDAVRLGKLIVVVDDEDRENEGDCIVAADFATPEAINFMTHHARGLVCLALSGDRAEALGLRLMVRGHQDPDIAAFTVPVDGRVGVGSGVSAADRAHTVRICLDPASGPRDLRQPGHVFPLIARPRGVLERAGHTEAAVDLARLAGLRPAGVLCEVLRPDGEVARLADLMAFARRHGLPITSVAKVIAYRLAREAHPTDGRCA